ncbi:MAG: CHRD domain-containing protein [Bryobacteraceae bacterium]
MRFGLFFVMCLYSAGASLAQGALIYDATLFGSGGVPSSAGVIGNTGSAGFGFVEFNFDTSTKVLTVVAPTSNFCCLRSNSTGIILTAPATSTNTGSTQFTLAGVPNMTSGSVPAQNFTLSAAQTAQLQAGQFYAVLKTTQFPLGELGGVFVQTGQANTVPEPSTFTFCGMALLLIAGSALLRAKTYSFWRSCVMVRPG